jgi:rRNA maturation RNase YbeY
MRIEIVNRQRMFRLAMPALRQVAAALAAKAATGEVWRAVTVIVVDDAGIEPFNRSVFGRGGPTDVISQRYAPVPGEPAGLVGELIVNAERAWQAGRRAGWSPSRELALYLAHGLDHLAGEDDATPAGFRRMRRRELRWLSVLRVPRLLPGPRQSG